MLKMAQERGYLFMPPPSEERTMASSKLVNTENSTFDIKHCFDNHVFESMNLEQLKKLFKTVRADWI